MFFSCSCFMSHQEIVAFMETRTVPVCNSKLRPLLQTYDLRAEKDL